MTKSDNPSRASLPLLLVYGRPTKADLPRASWFRIEDRTPVGAAAQTLKLTVVEITSERDRALLVDVSEGVLKDNGRMIVGPITPEVYKRIEECGVSMSVSTATLAPTDKTSALKSTQEQNTNISDPGNAGTLPAPPNSNRKAPATHPRDPWDALRVGDHVVAKYWETDGSPYGWWVGVIVEIVTDVVLVIRWPDEEKTQPLKIERKHVAILHPSYDVGSEWQRRR